MRIVFVLKPDCLHGHKFIRESAAASVVTIRVLLIEVSQKRGREKRSLSWRESCIGPRPLACQDTHKTCNVTWDGITALFFLPCNDDASRSRSCTQCFRLVTLKIFWSRPKSAICLRCSSAWGFRINEPFPLARHITVIRCRHGMEKIAQV